MPQPGLRSQQRLFSLMVRGTLTPCIRVLNFAVQHFGISMVHGRFDEFEGAIIADSAHLEKSSVKLVIKAASIDTNVKMRDDDLRSANYFNTDKYPTVVFESTRIEKALDYSEKHSSYTAYGKLTMHGVTREIMMPFEMNGPIKDPSGNIRIGIIIHLTVHRLDFGIGNTQKISNGALGIGNDVSVDLSVEAVEAKKQQ